MMSVDAFYCEVGIMRIAEKAQEVHAAAGNDRNGWLRCDL